MIFSSDGEIPGGLGSGDFPLWQLVALHDRQEREEGRVNLGTSFFWGREALRIVDIFMTSCELLAPKLAQTPITTPCIFMRNIPLLCVYVFTPFCL